MKAGGSKVKGSQFERDVCKALSLFVSRGQNKDVFWRSAMSGGRATVAMKTGDKLSRQAGDICAVAPEGHPLCDAFYFELKHYANCRLDSFLFGTGPLAGFWEHTKKEAAKHSKRPAMIVRTARFPVILILDRSGVFSDCHGFNCYDQDIKPVWRWMHNEDGTCIYLLHEVLAIVENI